MNMKPPAAAGSKRPREHLDRRFQPDRRWQDVTISFADRRRGERRQTQLQAMLWYQQRGSMTR